MSRLQYAKAQSGETKIGTPPNSGGRCLLRTTSRLMAFRTRRIIPMLFTDSSVSSPLRHHVYRRPAWCGRSPALPPSQLRRLGLGVVTGAGSIRSEEHTSELQSHLN